MSGRRWDSSPRSLRSPRLGPDDAKACAEHGEDNEADRGAREADSGDKESGNEIGAGKHAEGAQTVKQPAEGQRLPMVPPIWSREVMAADFSMEMPAPWMTVGSQLARK